MNLCVITPFFFLIIARPSRFQILMTIKYINFIFIILYNFLFLFPANELQYILC